MNGRFFSTLLERYLALTQEAAATHPTLIFWPEYAVDFHLQQESPLRAAVFQVVRDLGADLILGGQYYGYGVSDIYSHNSVFLVRRGKLAGRYDKVRLLPFAEENPFEQFFPRIRDRYEPGHHMPGLHLGLPSPYHSPASSGSGENQMIRLKVVLRFVNE